MPTDDEDNTRLDPAGARVVLSSDPPGCSSFSNTGIRGALVNLAKVRWLWIGGPIHSKANIPESRVFPFGSCYHLRPTGAGSWIARIASSIPPCAFSAKRNSATGSPWWKE
jgi:hypothetical protein